MINEKILTSGLGVSEDATGINRRLIPIGDMCGSFLITIAALLSMWNVLGVFSSFRTPAPMYNPQTCLWEYITTSLVNRLRAARR